VLGPADAATIDDSIMAPLLLMLLLPCSGSERIMCRAFSLASASPNLQPISSRC